MLLQQVFVPSLIRLIPFNLIHGHFIHLIVSLLKMRTIGLLESVHIGIYEVWVVIELCGLIIRVQEVYCIFVFIDDRLVESLLFNQKFLVSGIKLCLIYHQLCERLINGTDCFVVVNGVQVVVHLQQLNWLWCWIYWSLGCWLRKWCRRGSSVCFSSMRLVNRRRLLKSCSWWSHR